MSLQVPDDPEVLYSATGQISALLPTRLTLIMTSSLLPHQSAMRGMMVVLPKLELLQLWLINSK